MTEVSRQRERRRSVAAGLVVFTGRDVAPGGKVLTDEDELFDQAGRQYLALQPGFSLKFPRLPPEFFFSINHLRWILGLGF